MPNTEANERPHDAHPAAIRDRTPAPNVTCRPPRSFKNFNFRSTSSRFTPNKSAIRIIRSVSLIPKMEKEPVKRSTDIQSFARRGYVWERMLKYVLKSKSISAVIKYIRPKIMDLSMKFRCFASWSKT